MDPTTQEFLEIKEIREGVLILKNNNTRGILMVSSMNFALKSTAEQNAIIYAFQSFLNSLDFPCQIVIQSRKINITPYLDNIKALEEKQTSELLQAQTSSYRDFIKELVQGNSVMTKNFYMIVPYSAAELFGTVGALAKLNPLKGLKKDSQQQKQDADEGFEKSRKQLWQRMEFVAVGLKRCGLDVMPLTTPELIELFWSIHHPSEAEIGYYPKLSPDLLK